MRQKAGLVGRILGVGLVGAAALTFGGAGCVAGSDAEVTGQSSATALSTATTPIQIQDNTGKCVDTSSAFAWNNSVQVNGCNGGAGQNWTYNASTLALQIGGLCLDIPNANFVNGQNVRLWGCNGSPAQQWLYQQGMFVAAGSGNASINAYNHALCLNAGSLNNGQSLSLWSCWWGDPKFHFVMPAAATTFTSVVHLGPGTNVCLDTGGGTGNGTLVQAWPCNGSNAQTWTYNEGDGSLRNKGLCLDVPGGNFANMQQVQLWSCNGSPAQQWRYQGGNFIAMGSGNASTPYSGFLCLNDPYANTNAGTRLAVYQCNMGDAASIFSVPGAWHRNARDCTAAGTESDSNVAGLTGQLCNIWGSAMYWSNTIPYFKDSNGDEYNPNIQISSNVDWYIANAGNGTINGQTNRNYLLSTYASVNPVYARAVTPAECSDIRNSSYYNFLTEPTVNGSSVNTTVVASDSSCSTMLAYDPWVTGFYRCGYWC